MTTSSAASDACTIMTLSELASRSWSSRAIRWRSRAAARSVSSSRSRLARSASAASALVRSSVSPSATPTAHGAMKANSSMTSERSPVSTASTLTISATAAMTLARPRPRAIEDVKAGGKAGEARTQRRVEAGSSVSMPSSRAPSRIPATAIGIASASARRAQSTPTASQYTPSNAHSGP